MPTFVRKPVTVEAVLWDGTPETIEDLLSRSTVHAITRNPCNLSLFIPTLNDGVQQARVGDWVVMPPAGNLFPCDPTTFANEYEPAQ